MTHSLPLWTEWLRALAIPVIAAAGVFIAWSNHRLAQRKRQDDLFDRRFAFFDKACRLWTAYAEAAEATGVEEPDWEARASLINEARFLFGDDIVEHLRRYDRPFEPMFSHLPHEDFVKPFEKYLRFEK